MSRQKDIKTKRLKDENTESKEKGIEKRQKKTKRQRPKREFVIVMSG